MAVLGCVRRGMETIAFLISFAYNRDKIYEGMFLRMNGQRGFGVGSIALLRFFALFEESSKKPYRCVEKKE